MVEDGRGPGRRSAPIQLPAAETAGKRTTVPEMLNGGLGF